MMQVELVAIFRESNPELYESIARLVVAGKKKDKIAAAINASVERCRTQATPSAGN
jgi:hypothetical protein